jgi:hypothetical protein
MDHLDTLLKTLGALVAAGGGLVAIAYAIFRKFGEKWLDARFEERLAAYKHEQQKELERVRFQISALLDRATKLHQREFEVVPEAWAKLNVANWNVSAFVSPMQSHPDLNRMSAAQLKEFVAACELQEWQKQELLAEPDKTRYYIDQIFWHKLHEAKAASREASIFIATHGIFLPVDIKSRFDALTKLIWEALDEHEFNKRYGTAPLERKKQQALQTEAPPLLKELEALVQGRLWNSERVAA